MTTVTLRPDGTATTGAGASAVGGTGTLHGVTSDNSDASYILNAAQVAGATPTKLNTTTSAMAAGAITKNVKVRARGRYDTAGFTPRTFKVELRVSGVVKATMTTGALTATITDYASALTAVTLTQSQIDAAQLWLTAINGGTDVRVQELYWDLIYATQPVTAVSAPTGTITTTTSPLVQWSHTAGSDGGAQTKYQVKIFTAAQYGAGGFDPITSVATYDSGEVVGSAVDHTPPALANSVTYRAYVRTAQTINGTYHWSTYAFSGFDVSVTPPTITSVVPTPGGAGEISVVVNRNTGGPAWDHVTVERSRDSGATWEFVRNASYAVASGNTFTVVDYDAPHSINVLHRAQAFSGASGSIIGSPLVQSAAVQWTHTYPWLKSLTSPTSSRPVKLRETPQTATTETRTLTLNIKTDTAAEATALETLLGPIRQTGVFHVIGSQYPVISADAGSLLLFQAPPTWGITERWLAVLSYSQTHLDTRVAINTKRVYTVETVEVQRPPNGV